MQHPANILYDATIFPELEHVTPNIINNRVGGSRAQTHTLQFSSPLADSIPSCLKTSRPCFQNSSKSRAARTAAAPNYTRVRMSAAIPPDGATGRHDRQQGRTAMDDRRRRRVVPKRRTQRSYTWQWQAPRRNSRHTPPPGFLDEAEKKGERS